jgi:peroxiredoxin Q/BCP
MSDIKLGKKVPDIELHATSDKTIKFSDFIGKNLIVYFYPKASTPGCTQEGKDFSEAINKFRRQSTVILGVSRDTVKAQQNFKDKQAFPFELLSDKEEKLCSAFDVIKMKNMYGKQVRGIERSTFLIDREGKLQQQWRGVKVKNHVEEVLAAVKLINKK